MFTLLPLFNSVPSQEAVNPRQLTNDIITQNFALCWSEDLLLKNVEKYYMFFQKRNHRFSNHKSTFTVSYISSFSKFSCETRITGLIYICIVTEIDLIRSGKYMKSSLPEDFVVFYLSRFIPDYYWHLSPPRIRIFQRKYGACGKVNRIHKEMLPKESETFSQTKLNFFRVFFVRF